MIVYHGTSQLFDRFDYKRIGDSNGTGDGFGFYFTTSYTLARSYGPIVIEAEFSGIKSLSLTRRTIKTPQLRKLVLEVGYHENFGEVGFDPLQVILNRALASFAGDSDVEIIGGLINSRGGSNGSETVLNALYRIAGYDCIINSEEQVYIALVHSAYKIMGPAAQPGK